MDKYHESGRCEQISQVIELLRKVILDQQARQSQNCEGVGKILRYSARLEWSDIMMYV